MLNGRNFYPFLRNGLCVEASNTATLLKKNLLTLSRDLSPFQHFWKGQRSILTSLQNFGEICIITYHDNSHNAKIANQSTQGIQLGFSDGLSVDTCIMLNPKTQKLV